MQIRSLEVNLISYDPENPRIRMALEKYGDKVDEERIRFALQSATEGAKQQSSFSQLRDSIRASGGIKAPIIVKRDGDGYVCIDGNTRLVIYKQFLQEQTAGCWSEIKAIEVDAKPQDIEEIRVSAHLVGYREWPAYEKARYLYNLRNKEFMDYSQMIALCGGNKVDIERQISAFQEMNEYYLDQVEDDAAFKIDRFSGFVELQKKKIKDSIWDADLSLNDFGEWIRDGNIYRLADVRQLPKVLGNEKAREMFLNGGPRSIEKAIKFVDQENQSQFREGVGKTPLQDASLTQLAEELANRIAGMPYSELRSLKDGDAGAEELISSLEGLYASLEVFLKDVGE